MTLFDKFTLCRRLQGEGASAEELKQRPWYTSIKEDISYLNIFLRLIYAEGDLSQQAIVRNRIDKLLTQMKATLYEINTLICKEMPSIITKEYRVTITNADYFILATKRRLNEAQNSEAKESAEKELRNFPA